MHSRSVTKIIDVIGQIGGIFGIMMTGFGLVARFLNRRFSLLRILSQLYFCPDNEDLNKAETLF